PGGGERSAALEAELEGDEGEPVACEERRHERKPAAAAHRRLRPYVPRRVEEPRGRAEPRRRRQAAPVAEQRNRACRGSREREPEHDRAGGSLPPSAVLAGEGGGEEREPEQRGAHSGELALRRPHPRRPPGK